MTDTSLSVFEVPEAWGVEGAAIEYAKRGWYVLAVDRDTKRPASFYGKRWQDASTRDPEVIASWFSGTNLLLGLHVGRSNAIVFDIDKPDEVPEDLAKFLWDGDGEALTVFQSTRDNNPRQGHYVFTQPPGRSLGNSRGDLGKTWGEVRGKNGIIVVEPSAHTKASEGGRYRWEKWGDVPVLPEPISSRLPDLNPIEGEADTATDETMQAFMDSCTSSRWPALMKVPVRQFVEAVERGASRHETMVSQLCFAMREAAMGFYPAKDVQRDLWHEWQKAMNGERFPRPEFVSMLAFAIGQALVVDPQVRATEAKERLDQRDREQAKNRFDPATGSNTEDGEKTNTIRDPSEYYADKNIGCNVAMVAQDVIAMGPLAIGRDGMPWSYKNGVWRQERDAIKGRVVDLLGARYRQSHASNAADIVTRRVPRIMCDPTPDSMNFLNGMLDWRTGILRAHDPEDYSTIQHPFEWDENAECPRFDEFLASILHPDYVELVWEMIGYLLYLGNPMQVAFLLHGTGSNGKGTLLRVISHMLGAANCSFQSLNSLNNNKFAPVNLFGKTANIAGDIDGTFQESTAMFKMLTGEDEISAEHKYGVPFNFESYAVPVFTANKIPGSADVSHGYLRRWKIIRFERQFGKDDVIRGLSNSLLQEVPGIAAKAVKYLRRLMDAEQFVETAKILEGDEEFAETLDQVRQWLKDSCELIPAAEENRPDAYESYKVWAARNGHARPLKAQEFYNRLESVPSVEAIKRKGLRMFRGFQIVSGRMMSQETLLAIAARDSTES